MIAQTTIRLAAALALFATAASAAVPFDRWSHQRFSLFGGNTWQQAADSVSVASDGSVSMLWTALPPDRGGATRAEWTWQVDESVPPTALDQRGGDDRNLALYFVFMPEDIAEGLRNASIRQLLRVPEARVLMYVWGGDHARGALVPSPYLGDQGITVALRQAGTGRHAESVDLAADYRRAFGSAPPALVGLALSSDSDDTGTAVRAGLSGLALR